MENYIINLQTCDSSIELCFNANNNTMNYTTSNTTMNSTGGYLEKIGSLVDVA